MHHAKGKLPLVAAAPNTIIRPPTKVYFSLNHLNMAVVVMRDILMIGGQSPAWLHQKEPLSLRSKERAQWTTNHIATVVSPVMGRTTTTMRVLKTQ